MEDQEEQEYDNKDIDLKKNNSKLNWLKKTRDKMNSRGMKYNTNDMSGIISEMLLINE